MLFKFLILYLFIINYIEGLIGFNSEKNLLEQVRENNRKSASEIAHLSPSVKAYNQIK